MSLGLDHSYHIPKSVESKRNILRMCVELRDSNHISFTDNLAFHAVYSLLRGSLMGGRLYFMSLSSCSLLLLPYLFHLPLPSPLSPTHKSQIANSIPTHRHIQKLTGTLSIVTWLCIGLLLIYNRRPQSSNPLRISYAHGVIFGLDR